MQIRDPSVGARLHSQGHAHLHSIVNSTLLTYNNCLEVHDMVARAMTRISNGELPVGDSGIDNWRWTALGLMILMDNPRGIAPDDDETRESRPYRPDLAWTEINHRSTLQGSKRAQQLDHPRYQLRERLWWWRLAAPMLGELINWIIGELDHDSSCGREQWGW